MFRDLPRKQTNMGGPKGDVQHSCPAVTLVTDGLVFPVGSSVGKNLSNQTYVCKACVSECTCVWVCIYKMLLGKGSFLL